MCMGLGMRMGFWSATTGLRSPGTGDRGDSCSLADDSMASTTAEDGTASSGGVTATGSGFTAGAGASAIVFLGYW